MNGTGDHLLPDTLGKKQVNGSLEERPRKTNGVLPKPIDGGMRLKSVAAQIIVGLPRSRIIIHSMPHIAHFEVQRIVIDGGKEPRE